MEGKYLPVEHCLKGTPGWCVIDEIEDVSCVHINKTTFGYLNWDAWIDPETAVIELAGVCTDICLVSNALILKALYPEAIIAVDTRCCAGTTPERHQAALDTMKSCQIEVY
jgi:nicotinamidase-related amidase